MIEHFKEAIVLLISGIFGSLVRLLSKPEDDWKKWLARFMIGMFAAVFLGGFFSILLIKAFDISTDQGIMYARLASGFIVGTASEQIIDLIVAKIQSKGK